jgi:RNA polymerase sigma factor (sigma-70 family)
VGSYGVQVMVDRADREQLEALYRSRFVDFVRVAAGVTGDGDAAQDAVQEGFVRALRSLRGFRGDGPFEAWVWRIVLNAAFDRRSRSGAPRPVAEADVSAGVVEDAPSSDFARWVGELPERQRLAVFLRYRADLDYRSIALVLGEVGTVSATLHAAHGTLRRLLEEVSR